MEAEHWHRLKADPAFRDFMAEIAEMRETAVTSLVGGNTLKKGPETVEATARVVGVISGLDKVLTFTPTEERKKK